MGLFDKRNIDKAKALAEKNKEKIAAGVNKATGVIDQKTGGKHSDKLRKVDEAAQKYAGPVAAPTDRAAGGVAAPAEQAAGPDDEQAAGSDDSAPA